MDAPFPLVQKTVEKAARARGVHQLQAGKVPQGKKYAAIQASSICIFLSFMRPRRQDQERELLPFAGREIAKNAQAVIFKQYIWHSMREKNGMKGGFVAAEATARKSHDVMVGAAARR